MDFPGQQRQVTGPVARAIDGATGDWSVSGDAMRWSAELADHPPPERIPGDLLRLDLPGLGGGVGLDLDGVRRLVSGALNSLGAVAGDVVTEIRQLTRGPAEDDDVPMPTT